MTLLKCDSQTDTHKSLATYKESIMSDINFKVRIHHNETLYTTHITSWEDDLITLAAPLSKLDWVLLPLQGHFKIDLITKTALYTTWVQIIKSLKPELGTLNYVCQITKPIIRKQQRQTFRLETLLDSHFEILNDDFEPINPSVTKSKGTILNISLGGLCFTSDTILAAGTPVVFHFHFLDEDFSLIGKILLDGMPTSSGSFSYRVQFINLSRADDAKLSRMIMAKQRLLRQKS